MTTVDAPALLRYAAAVPDQLFSLEALGIPVVDGTLPALHAECVRAARRLKEAGGRAIGLLPASSEVAVLPVGIQLASALTELTGGAVAYVDANARWPALSREEWRSLPEELVAGFAVRRVGPLIRLLTPHAEGGAGAGVVLLDALLGEDGDHYARLLVDLTGFRELGDHLAAIRSLDGVVIVARAGHTREADLLKLNHALAPEKNLGVLLVGGQPA